jgi:hypothetical protein
LASNEPSLTFELVTAFGAICVGPTEPAGSLTAAYLLREGASLIDIGQVLRHRHLESTAIYGKVDLAGLRQAALPWPGAAR